MSALLVDLRDAFRGLAPHPRLDRGGPADTVVHVDRVSSGRVHGVSLSVVDPVSGLRWTRLLASPPGRTLNPGERMTLHYRPVQTPEQLEMTLQR